MRHNNPDETDEETFQRILERKRSEADEWTEEDTESLRNHLSRILTI